MKRTVALLLTLLVLGQSYAGICDTARLYFATGDANLSKEERQKIDGLIKQGIFTKGEKISITGFADYVGEDTANLELSKKRAEAVATYMIGKGWKQPDILVTQGVGEVAGTGYNAEEGNAENRRVEIIAYSKFTADNMPRIIFFDAGTDTVRRDNFNKLDSLVTIMREHPCMKISIEGHTCCTAHEKQIPTNVPTTKYVSNSISRTMQVERYLINKGIERNRLGFNAHGTGKPLYSKPKNDEEHRMNCRAEIKIMK